MIHLTSLKNYLTTSYLIYKPTYSAWRSQSLLDIKQQNSSHVNSLSKSKSESTSFSPYKKLFLEVSVFVFKETYLSGS